MKKSVVAVVLVVLLVASLCGADCGARSTVLGFWDFLWILLIVSLLAGGSAACSPGGAKDSARLRRIEEKQDLILKHLGLQYKDPATPGGLSEEVKALANDPSQKIAAIKLLREQTGLGLKEAKDAVEAYMAGRG